jgi:hypothetical protein
MIVLRTLPFLLFTHKDVIDYEEASLETVSLVRTLGNNLAYLREIIK